MEAVAVQSLSLGHDRLPDPGPPGRFSANSSPGVDGSVWEWVCVDGFQKGANGEGVALRLRGEVGGDSSPHAEDGVDEFAHWP